MLSNLETLLRSPSLSSIFNIKSVKLSTKNWEAAKQSLLEGFAHTLLTHEKTAKEVLSDERITAIIFENKDVQEFLVKKLQKEITQLILKDRQTQQFVLSHIGKNIKEEIKKHRGILRAFDFILKRQLG